MHLVGFIIRIYHDARFSECQTGLTCLVLLTGDSRSLWNVSTHLPYSQHGIPEVCSLYYLSPQQLKYCTLYV